MTLRLVFPLMKSEKSRLMFGAFPIHQNAAWAIIVHPSYFFQRQLSFVLSHQWDWLICIGILFERFPFMAVFFTQVLREGHIAKWTESWHSWALKDREKWTASYLYQNEKKCLRRDVEMLCCYEMKDLWLQFLEATFLCTRSPWYTHDAGVVGAHWYRCSPFVCCRSSWKCGMDLYIKLRSVGSCKTSKIWEKRFMQKVHMLCMCNPGFKLI